jgi:glycogen synthase
MTPHRPFSESAEREAKAGRGDAILGEKLAKRRVMLEALTEFRPAQCIGSLQCDGSRDLTGLADNVPVFMMFGRMDPGQKGFDLLAHAIQDLRPGIAKFVICPIIPPDVQPFVDQWYEVADFRPGDVVVYTGRMQKYFETMAGVSFCVMPSLHEPFGAATEPYLQGTPVVAHGTGGLIQQVVNYRDQPGQATGVLFHHTFQPGPEERGEQWRAIMTELEPNARLQSPLYVSLVNALTAAIELAAEIYCNRSLDYAKMLANMFDRSMQFSWDKAATEYNCIYDCVSRIS